jgi:predicted acyl esterase
MPETASLKVETNIPVPMRDGTTLYADIIVPTARGLSR